MLWRKTTDAAMAPVSSVPATDVEEAAWDSLFDTQAMRCCDCPSCNSYLPEHEYKPETKCVVVEAIERIIAAKVAEAEVAALRFMHDWCRDVVSREMGVLKGDFADGWRQASAAMLAEIENRADRIDQGSQS
jgi:hypothetical protein